MTWSSRSASSFPISEANGPGVRPDPAGSIDDLRPFDDPGQVGCQVLRTGRARSVPWPARTPAPRPAAHRRSRSPALAPTGRSPSARRPANRPTPGARRVPPGGRRWSRRLPRAEPMQQARLPDPVVAPPAATPHVVGHRARTPRSTPSTSGKAEPKSRLARSWNAAVSPVVSWRCVTATVRSSGRSWPAAPASAAVPRVVPGASMPLTLSSSARAEAVAVAESTIATRSPTAAAMTDRNSG